VCMEPPKAADHVANICVLQVYIATDPVVNEYYTPELEEYLTRFANMCEQGAFEALQDVAETNAETKEDAEAHHHNTA
jgi:predicted esterase